MPIPLLLLLFSCLCWSAEPGPDPDWAAVLASAVKADGVDYAGLRRDPAALDRFLARVATAPEPGDRGERLAFFINAYNACTIRQVLDRLPADPGQWAHFSVKQQDGFWSSTSFAVAGANRTLDDIEQRVLRPLSEPHIHLALNCASRSCPALAATPYTAAAIDAELETAARAFAASPYHLRLEDGTLRVNQILEWYHQDFATVGGVRGFLLARVPAGAIHDHFAHAGAISHWSYDWDLNLAKPTP